MKPYLILSVLVTALYFSTAIAQSPYVTLQEIGEQREAKNEELKKQKLDVVVGKSYWIKPNPDARNRLEFWDRIENVPIRDKGFAVSKEVSFKIDGYEKDLFGFYCFRIIFQDGKTAWMRADPVQPIRGLFVGTRFDPDSEYIFDGLPDEVLARHVHNSLMTAAAAQAKGGVKIGMTGEQVLRSNWGTPERINKTTTSRSFSEQWIYGGGNYLYFKNGILVVIQN